MEGGERVAWRSRNLVGGWEVEITGLVTWLVEVKRHRSGFEAPASWETREVGWSWGAHLQVVGGTRYNFATSMYPPRVYMWNECTTSLYIGCQAYRWSVQTDSERGD